MQDLKVGLDLVGIAVRLGFPFGDCRAYIPDEWTVGDGEEANQAIMRRCGAEGNATQ